MMRRRIFEKVCITVVIIVIIASGCKKCDLDCGVAPIVFSSVPVDSVGFGQWEWSYTVKKVKDWQDEWVVSDTILPGEPVEGYETLDYVYGTIDEGRICFNISGRVVDGCYKSRHSALLQTSSGPTNMVVGCVYQEWDNPLGQYSMGVDMYLPIVEGNLVIGQMGLRMYHVEDEDAEGVLYRHFFVKT